MPFAQFSPVGPQYHGEVGKLRRLKSQSLIQEQVTGGAGEPLLSSENMSYLHKVVINHIGKVIGRVAI